MTATVLLLGNFRPTLTVARQLAPLGYRIIVTRGAGAEGCSQYSRYVDECWDHPPVEQTGAFFTALAEFLKARPDITIVYPILEQCVKGLALYKDLLPQDRIYATPPAETVLTCLDKPKMIEIAKRAGVPVADFAVARDHAALLSEATRIGFPVVVRPVSSAVPVAGKKVLMADSAEELRRALPDWPSAHDELIVQARVKGRRHNLYFAASNGRPIRYLAAEIIRSHKADGTGLAVEGETIELEADIRRYADSLLRSLDYTGVGCIQFQVDRATGHVTFLELNPRIAGNHAITEACGLNLTGLAIDLACGRAQHVPLSIGAAGKRYAWTYGDLRGLLAGVVKDKLTVRQAAAWLMRMVKTSIRANTHMTWSWSDPLPTLMMFTRFLRQQEPAAVPATETADDALPLPFPSGQKI